MTLLLLMVHRTVEATESNSSSDKQGVLAFMSTKKTPNSVVVLSMSTPSTGPGSSASASCSEGQGPVEALVEEGTAAAAAVGAEQGGTGNGYWLLSYIPIFSIYLYPYILSSPLPRRHPCSIRPSAHKCLMTNFL